jgi:two-component system cell cycle sensor histidine kinase/response regulator CckA
MTVKDQDYWEKMLAKLKAENLSIREKLATLRGDRKNLEKSLKTRKTIFDALPVAVVLVQQGKIVEINRTALDQTGYSEKECIGRDFLDFMTAESRAFMNRLLKNGLSGKSGPSQHEAELVRKGGETLVCDVRVTRIRYRDRTAFLSILSRLEGRKKQEKEVIQAEKMEALMTMASCLNRKISGSLKAISDNALRVRNTGNPDDRNLLRGLKNIEDAAGQIAKTTRELDSLSRREPDRSKVTVFDLKKIVKDVTASTGPRIRAEAERRGVKLNLKTYLRSVSPLEGDPREIRDVIISMLLNAADAMPNGGDIYLSIEENGGHAHIYVQDSGVGIAARANGRILDPYFTTKGGDGIGLGLSLSYAIVKRHQGEMEVTSKQDQGTTVAIKLPLARVEPDRNMGFLKKRIKNARILIMTHEPMIGGLLAQVLRGKGYRIVSAASGSEGLNRIKRKQFDLVIADAAIPEMGGEILLERITRRDPQLPIVLIRSGGRGKKADPSGTHPVPLILTKPINMDKVANQISEVLLQRAGRA